MCLLSHQLLGALVDVDVFVGSSVGTTADDGVFVNG